MTEQELPAVARSLDEASEFQLIWIFQAMTKKTKEEIQRALDSAAIQQG